MFSVLSYTIFQKKILLFKSVAFASFILAKQSCVEQWKREEKEDIRMMLKEVMMTRKENEGELQVQIHRGAIN